MRANKTLPQPSAGNILVAHSENPVANIQGCSNNCYAYICHKELFIVFFNYSVSTKSSYFNTISVNMLPLYNCQYMAGMFE